MSICTSCQTEYERNSRRNKPGLITVCEECAEEVGDVQEYTGVMIYSHKTGCSIQINSDPELTNYLIDSTKLKNKGSNMTNNIQSVTKYKKMSKTEGACLKTADSFNYKNRDQ